MSAPDDSRSGRNDEPRGGAGEWCTAAVSSERAVSSRAACTWGMRRWLARRTSGQRCLHSTRHSGLWRAPLHQAVPHAPDETLAFAPKERGVFPHSTNSTCGSTAWPVCDGHAQDKVPRACGHSQRLWSLLVCPGDASFKWCAARHRCPCAGAHASLAHAGPRYLSLWRGEATQLPAPDILPLLATCSARACVHVCPRHVKASIWQYLR